VAVLGQRSSPLSGLSRRYIAWHEIRKWPIHRRKCRTSTDLLDEPALLGSFDKNSGGHAEGSYRAYDFTSGMTEKLAVLVGSAPNLDHSRA